MAEVKSVICDICGGQDAERWAISKRPLKGWAIDLCAEHAAPLMDMRKHAHTGEGGVRPYRRLGKTPIQKPPK